MRLPDSSSPDRIVFQPPPPPPRRSAGWQKPLLYLSLILFGAGSALVGARILGLGDSTTARLSLDAPPSPLSAAQSLLSPAPNSPNSPRPNPLRNFVTDVVGKVGPAVVRIDASRRVSAGLPGQFANPFFRRFFGEDLPTPGQREQRGSGSGFVVTADGQIFTNAHVVEGADQVTVTLKDGRKFPGKVLGADSLTDVAVVKIEAKDLPIVPLGNSSDLQPGEWAIAIGNPLGLDNSVTTGIISATGRSSAQIGAPDKRVNFIQTDAAINPGNSGGPLINEQGEVIGMNTAIIRDAQGIGFAIPIERAKQIATQIVTKGRVDHPFIGVQMMKLTPELKQQINDDPNAGVRLGIDAGVLVMRIVPRSPAATAGLRPGDAIFQVNGKVVEEPSEVQSLVEAAGVNGKLELAVHRNGQNLSLAVQPVAMPQQAAAERSERGDRPAQPPSSQP